MPKRIEVKSVLNKTKRRDPWFLDDYTFNPYSSCSFNCLYCYIRGSKYGKNLSKSISIKANAIEILDRQLMNRAKKNQHGIIVLSSATDPYLKLEEEHQLTRQALEVILKHRFPVHIITKSNLVMRDFDLLHEIDRTAIVPSDLQLDRGVIISYSFSTLHNSIAKIFEPGATYPTNRIEALQSTLDHGFLSGVNLMPLLPYISDTTEQLHLAFSTFRDLGVDYLLPATITLWGNSPADSKTLMLKAIAKHFPHLEEKYHAFFDHSTQMPQYYQDAFKKKMKELLGQYSLVDNILIAAKSKA